MKLLRVFFLALLGVFALGLSGCVWGDQDADETADNVVKGLSGQGTLSDAATNSSNPGSWLYRN